jgi:hypothetical protein
MPQVLAAVRSAGRYIFVSAQPNVRGVDAASRILSQSMASVDLFEDSICANYCGLSSGFSLPF